MFSTSVFDNLPVFVNTGEHYLKEFAEFVLEHGFRWIAGTLPDNRNFDSFIKRFSEDVGLYLYEADGQMKFLFDGIGGIETEECLGDEIEKTVSILDLISEKPADLSDFDDFF